MKKILLIEGESSVTEYDDMSISTNLYIYDEKSATHLIGDVSLSIKNKEEEIAAFYIDKDRLGKVYYTRIYKNYFLTFAKKDTNYYLLIEKADFNKEFALMKGKNTTIVCLNDLEIEITDCIHEWGYSGPPENPGSLYNDVNYVLKVKAGDVVKSFSFYSSEIKDNYPIEFGNYRITILSDSYHHTSCFLEMTVNINGK